MTAHAGSRITDPVLHELSRSVKEPWARRVIACYEHKQPLLRVAVSAMQLVHEETAAPTLKLCTELLLGLVRIDCGFLHLFRDWCRVQRLPEGDATARLRRALLHELQASLATACQKVGLACLSASGSSRTKRRLVPGHGCLSIGGIGEPGGARAARRARLSTPEKRSEPTPEPVAQAEA